MNKLAQSTSPYLQQHANNPVDWFEWGPEAFDLAREQGKPILLSIGYSACHWCHVMAHESFEDVHIAAIMNEHFVNIKVDREERPDIDQIYQTAHAMLTQKNGGWPLTMFLSPDTTPFFGGTYFPKSARYGLPGFDDLLQRVAQYFAQQQEAIGKQNAELRRALDARNGNAGAAFEGHALEVRVNKGVSGNAFLNATPDAALTRAPIDAAFAEISRSFDKKRGGFGRAPKFPHPEMIECALLRYAETMHQEAPNEDARAIALTTLERMVRGGIFDQLGGGFARYSVDETWTIPHFEKMLYDNGPLLRLLADARTLATNDLQRRLFGEAAEETADWVMREMQSEVGGYFSTIDADSEGHEGKFYVWTGDEVRRVLTEHEARVAILHLGFDRPANFEEHFWNPIHAETIVDLAHLLQKPEVLIEEVIASAKEKLFAAREKRIHPGRDEKILTSWNALMIEGMAHAGRILWREDWQQSARAALDFVRLTMWDRGRKRLYATHKDGKTHLNAYLDDYAFMLRAVLEMLQVEFRLDDLLFARELADVLLTQFEDRERGGFYFTSHDHEKLITRPKPSLDNATPSGNGVAAFALQRLSHITGEARYAHAAERTLRIFSDAIDDNPSAHATLLAAQEEWLSPPTTVILTGPVSEAREWALALTRLYLPHVMVFNIANLDPATLPEGLRRPVSAAVNAYVCQGVSCLPTIRSLDELREALKSSIM